MNNHPALKISALIVGLLGLGLGSSAVSNATSLTVPERTLSEQIDLIEPHTQIRVPGDATDPVGALLMFHGCGGLKNVQDGYAEAALEAGYAVVIVDSLAARGIGRFGAMSQVCTAMRLWGQERSADVFAAVQIAASDARIDADRLALAGWSHGGWTMIDALAASGQNQTPEALLGDMTPLAEQVRAAILIYPYCGFPVGSDGSDLDPDIPVFAILAENDLVAPNRDCRATLTRARDAGVSVEFAVWDGLTHAFDKPGPSADPRMEYNPDAAQRAYIRVVDILDQVLMTPG
jgi:dienelactone hydrolase